MKFFKKIHILSISTQHFLVHKVRKDARLRSLWAATACLICLVLMGLPSICPSFHFNVRTHCERGGGFHNDANDTNSAGDDQLEITIIGDTILYTNFTSFNGDQNSNNISSNSSSSERSSARFRPSTTEIM